MRLFPPIVDAPRLFSALKSKQPGFRLLDCTFVPLPRPPDEFNRCKYYGNFEAQIAGWEPSASESYCQFLTGGHIPPAVHFNLALATHPTVYEKLALYPSKIFESYAQLLGLNSADHLVFYSRGPLGGMMFAARAYWMFKAYGHSESSLTLLNGGFQAWLNHGFPFKSTKTAQKLDDKKGNWKATLDPPMHFIKFEELTTAEGTKLNGKQILLDTRKREQYEGPKLSERNGADQAGSHLPGAINLPTVELIDMQTGLLKNVDSLQQLVESSGLSIEDVKRNGQPLICLCNTGMQASLTSVVLDTLLGLPNVRLYGGSMSEIQTRAPELITARGSTDN